MNALAEPIMQSPELPEILHQLQSAFTIEQQRRRKFYDEIQPDQKAEFINGEVIVQSPAKARHIQASDHLMRLISLYVDKHGLGRVMHEKALTTFPRNDYEPDVMFFGTEKAAAILPDQFRMPVPDLAIEVVSDSTERRDRGVKFQDYARHGVGEYWIVDPEAETIEIYRREGDSYAAAAARQSDGVVRSEVIAGLEFPVRAAFDPAVNLEVVTAILTPLPR